MSRESEEDSDWLIVQNFPHGLIAWTRYPLQPDCYVFSNMRLYQAATTNYLFSFFYAASQTVSKQDKTYKMQQCKGKSEQVL